MKQRFIAGLLIILAVFCILTVASAEKASDYDDTVRLLRQYAGTNDSTVEIHFSSVYDPVKHIDDIEYAISEAGIAACSIEYNSEMIKLADIVWFPNLLVCSDIDDIENAIAEMATRKVTDYTLCCTADTFDALSSQDFSMISVLAGRYGIDGWRISYGKRAVNLKIEHYSEIHRTCSSLEEAKKYICEQSDLLSPAYSFVCDPALFTELMADNAVLLTDIMLQCGVSQQAFSDSPDSSLIMLENIEYYPGFRIATLYNQDRVDEMTPQEKEVLQVALEMLNDCVSDENSWLQTEKNIHDAICRRVTYTLSTSEPGVRQPGDTAIGALLYRQADCDGYSDAFCLLAKLAGFTVNYQHGEAAEEMDTGNGPFGESSHLWNRIQLGDNWYLVDVTWDDMDQSDVFRYCWLNAGKDIAAVTHIWDAEAQLVPLAEATEHSFFCYTSPKVNEAAYVTDAATLAEMLLSGESGSTVTLSVMIPGKLTGTEWLETAFDDAMEKHGLYGRYEWQAFPRVIGDMTYLIVSLTR